MTKENIDDKVLGNFQFLNGTHGTLYKEEKIVCNIDVDRKTNKVRIKSLQH